MKKFISFFVALTFVLSGLVMPASAEDFVAGSIIKTENSSTLYYLGDDSKLYVFPNSKTYFSWFSEFDNIITISEEDFGTYQLGGNVRYKPGSLLVKTPSSFKVYAVGMNGELRWVKTETLAKKYYGNNWNKLVDDVPDGFFTNYNFGEPIEDEADYDPREVEEQAETISHSRGWKKVKKIQKRTIKRAEKHCENLENSLNRLRERSEKFGFELPDVTDEYVEACENAVEKIKNNKVYFCKTDEEGNSHSVYVSRNAMFAHLKNGAKLGPCEDGDGSEDDDEDNDESDNDTEDVLEISSISEEIGTSSAKISWLTNIEASSMIEYSLYDDLSSSSMEEMSDEVTEHEIELIGLGTSTTYYYMISSEDADSNLATSSIRSFTTDDEEVVDEDAPLISAVSASPTSETAVITWDTDEEADSKVVYATESITSTTPTEVESESDMLTSHEIELTSLASSTMYYFYVESKDEAGNIKKSEEFDFETLE